MSDILKDWLGKFSAYDLINNFIPGAVFVILAEKVGGLTLATDNVFDKIVLYYVAGVIISRIGSIVVEPILKNLHIKKWWFVKHKDHTEYAEAEHWEQDKDRDKLVRLSAVNNMYRTFVSMFLFLLIVVIVNKAFPYIWSRGSFIIISCLVMIVLFAFSYRKQTRYVRSQIETDLRLKAEENNNNKEKHIEEQAK